MKGRDCFIIVIVLTFLQNCCLATHFRGAIITYEKGPTINGRIQVGINYRIAWRRSSSGNFCNSATIRNGNILGEGTLTCLTNCNGNLGPMDYQCTDFSVSEDWTSGRGHINVSLPTSLSPLYEFGFTGCCWISTLEVGNDGNWELRVRANLTTRSDTGRVNSPPGSDITPIVRLHTGCNNTIRIPVYDADGDTVRCRWAIGNECSDVCNAFPGAVLDEETCTITYQFQSLNTRVNGSLYAVALQIEDFVGYSSNSQPLSSIPLQFLVHVSNGSCQTGSRPVFGGETLPDQSCITVPYGSNFITNITILVQDNSSISEIQTISPVGLIKGPLRHAYWNSSIWSMQVTWVPDGISTTNNLFCYTAITSLGLTSEKRCINLLNEAVAPNFINSTRNPIRVTDSRQQTFSIELDKGFTWPTETAFINVYNSSGTLVDRISASDTYLVNHSGNVLEFHITQRLEPGQTYRIVLDKGVVTGTAYCRPPSPSYEWQIDVHTPVRLVNGTRLSEGQLEIYSQNQWKTVCSRIFNISAAQVVCRMLGYGHNISEATSDLLERTQVSKLLLLQDQDRVGEFKNKCIDDIQLEDVVFDEKVVLDHLPTSGITVTDLMESDTGLTSPNLVMEALDEADAFFPDSDEQSNQKFRKRPSQPVKKIYWSKEEEEEINKLFKSFFDTKTWPKPSHCVKAIRISFQVRLVDGYTSHSGRVELFDKHNGSWSTVCGNNFGDKEANVVCRTLGYGKGRVDNSSYYGYPYGRGIRYLDCQGTEEDVAQCLITQYHSQPCYGHGMDAGVMCGTEIRLVNGYSPYSGRVEVKYKGQWGTICDDSFGDRDARVICHMLGFYVGDSYLRAYGSARFGQGRGRITIDDLSCDGNETDISLCVSLPWLQNNCNHGEDASLDCQYGLHSSVSYTTAPTTTVRLVNGNSRYSGRVEVWHNGQWGTICDDNFDHREVMVICRMLGMNFGSNYGVAYSSAYFGSGSGPILLDDLQCYGHENVIQSCGTIQWGRNDCSHSEDVGVDCRGLPSSSATSNYGTTRGYITRYYYTRSTTSSYPFWLSTTYRYRLEDAVTVSCNENGWNVRVHMSILQQIYPNAVAGDIYLGDNSCTGVDRGYDVIFQQGLRDCLTSEVQINNNLVYRNQLVYAERDRLHPFIIRHFNWTVDVECDVGRNETSSGHLHHDSNSNNAHHVAGSSHYAVNMTFFSDPNFLNQLQGNPLHVQVGQNVYVKVFSTASDWTIKMKLQTCYTKPSPTAGDHLNLYIIQNGCEVDTNTHIISQSTHETRFVFQDFQYSSNKEGIYVYCQATFCETSDYSAQCTQACNPFAKRNLVIPGANLTDDDKLANTTPLP